MDIWRKNRVFRKADQTFFCCTGRNISIGGRSQPPAACRENKARRRVERTSEDSWRERRKEWAVDRGRWRERSEESAIDRWSPGSPGSERTFESRQSETAPKGGGRIEKGTL